MSTLNRVSTDLVRFLGAQLSTEIANGKFSNVFRQSELRTTVPAAVRRLTQQNLQPASISTEQYHIALSYLQKAGSEPAAASALAVAFLDVAQALQIPVATLIANTDSNTLKLLDRKAYSFLNRLRDPTSALGDAFDVDNSSTLLQRFFETLEPAPEPEPAPPSWDEIGDFPQIVNPPLSDSVRTRRTAFSRDSALFAISVADSDFPVRIFNTSSWQTVIDLDLAVDSFLVSSMAFSPRDNLLAVGFYSNSGQQGLRIVNTTNWQLLLNFPQLEFVNSLSWSPDGNLLAVVHAPSSSASVLTVYNRNNWSVAYEVTDNVPVRPIKVRFSPDGSRLAVYGNEETVLQRVKTVLYNTSTWQVTQTLEVAGGNRTYGALGPDFAWAGNGRYIVVPGSELGAFEVWVGDTVTGNVQLLNIDTGQSYAAVTTPDGTVIVCGEAGPADQVIAVLTQSQPGEPWQQTHSQAFQGVSFVPHVSVSPDGNYVALADFSAVNALNPLILGPPEPPVL